MKTVLKKQKVEVSDDLEMHQFRVAASAEMFELLASSLYSRKYEAVVRELACNAYDAHVQAGRQNKPFEIKIPTAFDDVFSIRDYGPGLTPDQVRELYTVMGLSDKTHTNDMVGAFGVGSKSPFSVTRHFSVESFIDGKKWTWAALLNEENIPSITLADEVFTDEPNGLRISFASTSKQEWHEAIKALRWFDVKPICNIKVPDRPEFEVEGDDWGYTKIKRASYYYRNQKDHEFYCVMGNVQYEVDKSKFVHITLPNGKYWLFVDIGDVSPAASREYLRYDDKTVNHLRGMIERIEQEIKQVALNQIKNAPNVQEAVKIWSESADFLKLGKMEYKGKTYDFVVREERKFTKIQNDRQDRLERFAHRLVDSYKKACVWADEKRAKNIRAMQIQTDNNYSCVYVFDEDCKDLAEKCGMPYHKVSEVEYSADKKPSTYTGPSQEAKKDMLVWVNGTWIAMSGDVPKKAWWIQIGWNRFSWSKTPVAVKQENYTGRIWNLNTYLSRAKKAGYEPGFPIIGVKTRALDEIPKEWLHLSEFTNGIKEFISEFTVDYSRFRALERLLNALPLNIWLEKHKDLQDEYADIVDKMNKLKMIFGSSMMREFLSEEGEYEDIEKLITKAKKAFPVTVFQHYRDADQEWRDIANGQDYP